MFQAVDFARYLVGRLVSSVLIITFLYFSWDHLMAGPYANLGYLLLFLATPGPELLVGAGLAVLSIFEDDF